MKPTQAQIEAAAKAFHEQACDGEWPCTFCLDGAEAALTAAAEIGGQSGQAPVSLTSRWESPASPASRQGGPTAAAEAGEQRGETYWIPLGLCSQHIKDERVATIERCAQVAQRYLDAGHAENIPTVIRAIKD